MLKYRTHDGELLKGDSFQDIINQLRLGSKFASGENETEFMNGFRIRWGEYSGQEFKGDNPESWVLGLVQAGFMELESEE